MISFKEQQKNKNLNEFIEEDLNEKDNKENKTEKGKD